MLEEEKTGPDRIQGLSAKQAKKLLDEMGENTLVQKKKVNALKIFGAQFKDLMTIILLVATALSVTMGEVTEAISIVTIVFLNAVMGFIQEFKTERTLEALKNMAAPSSTVIRDGEQITVPAKELVPGDILLIEAGDKVPADAILRSVSNLQVDESLLTGESVPVIKVASSAAKCANEVGKPELIYMGTIVTKGRGMAEVIDTGMRTQMGHIAGMLGEIEEEATPLQNRLAQLGKYIAIGCLVICSVVSVTGILRGEPVFDMIVTGISLAVAAVPEGLPAIVTIALALAVGRMLKRNALVRRLHAVETLGCASVICSDKTGTLTENKMTVRELAVAGGHFDVSGSGFELEGECTENGVPIRTSRYPALEKLFETGVICSSASIHIGDINVTLKKGKTRSGRTQHVVESSTGDPTEVAILIAAAKAGIYGERLRQSYRVIDEIPFDSDRKRMSVVVAHSGQRELLCKGAPDVVLERCTGVLTPNGVKPLTAGEKKLWLQKNEDMASKALRVLAFCYRPYEGRESDPEQGLILLGFAGMIDPPRKEAFEAVRTCKKAGIRPVMITGDHKVTAAAIAKDLGILRQGDDIMTGEEIDRCSDGELTKRVQQTSVFARVSPNHKLRIVRAFKRNGHVVAMTGDGVNDAPAIKEADIGVAMGQNGTDVTKEASSIILLDDNFATLVAAIEEGRVIYANIRKFIRYLLSCNIGEVLTMFVGMLMGLPMVLQPIQILLVNLATDGLPAIALGLEPAEDGVMTQKPRRKDDSVFSNGLATKIIFRGILIGLTTLAVFVSLFKETASLDIARTGAYLALVLTQLIHVFECKSEKVGLFGVKFLNNKKLIGAVFVSGLILYFSIYNPVLQIIFRTVALSVPQLILVVGYCFIVPIIYSFIAHHGRKLRNDAKEKED